MMMARATMAVAAVLVLAGCASRRAATWDERGEDYLHSGVDLHAAPIAEGSLAPMALPNFDWPEYWRPSPDELPNKYGRAAHAFSRAAQIEPGEPRFHVHLGVSFLGLRQPDRAEESFRRALALDPANVLAAHGLAAAEAALRARPPSRAAVTGIRR